VWEAGDPRFEEARALRPATVEEAAAWVNRRPRQGTAAERGANLGAILAAQAHYLTERLLDRQARDFEKEGGFAERLYRARAAAREEEGETDQTDQTDSREQARGQPATGRPAKGRPTSASSVSSVPPAGSADAGQADRTDEPDTTDRARANR
jgi:four helix bundle suffix protein